jgi:hypothetical protein
VIYSHVSKPALETIRPYKRRTPVALNARLSGMERDHPRSLRVLLRKSDYRGGLWEYAINTEQTIWVLLILTPAYLALTVIGTVPGPWHLFDHVQP